MSIQSDYRNLQELDTADGFGRQGGGLYLQAGLGLKLERWVDGAAVGISAPAPIIGTYMHLGYTYDGTTLSLYKDGFLATRIADGRARGCDHDRDADFPV